MNLNNENNMRYLLCLFMFFICSCYVNKKTLCIKTPPLGRLIGKIEIPKGYSFVGYGGGEYVVYEYRYNDSSFIYFTNGPYGGPNHDVIEKQHLSIWDLSDASHKNDTLILEGTTANGLLWKYCFWGDIGIGYKNVDSSKKDLFEAALKSATIKKSHQ